MNLYDKNPSVRSIGKALGEARRRLQEAGQLACDPTSFADVFEGNGTLFQTRQQRYQLQQKIARELAMELKARSTYFNKNKE